MVEKDWYSNKDLFKMIDGFKNDVSELRVELKETKTLIRDYNDLRKTLSENVIHVNKLEKKIDSHTDSRKEYIGYIIAVVSMIFLLLNYIS